MPKDGSAVLSEIKRGYIETKLKEGVRSDGRKLDEFRKISIQTNYIPRANGSAFVNLGNTKILVGIKVESGEPFPDTPNQGVLTTNVELLPMAFPTFEPGPPNDESIEIARVVDRGIRESKMIDLEKLCVEPGKKVMIVFVDIDILDYDGNLIDACTMGVASALSTAYYKTDDDKKEQKLPVRSIPVAVTVSKIGTELLCDPDLEEEQMASARLTVTLNDNGNLCAMQKGNSGTFTIDEVKKAIAISDKAGKDVRAYIKQVI